jgi:hypothetical protein
MAELPADPMVSDYFIPKKPARAAAVPGIPGKDFSIPGFKKNITRCDAGFP